jgi:hypothetical protein
MAFLKTHTFLYSIIVLKPGKMPLFFSFGKVHANTVRIHFQNKLYHSKGESKGFPMVPFFPGTVAPAPNTAYISKCGFLAFLLWLKKPSKKPPLWIPFRTHKYRLAPHIPI